MTEPGPQHDWFTTANPSVLLDLARPPEKETSKPYVARDLRWALYDRRCRLFRCACARMVWELLPCDARSGVVAHERFALERATHADLRAAQHRPPPQAVTCQQYALLSAIDQHAPSASWYAAKALATRAAGPAPFGGSPVPVEWQTTWNTTFAAARAHQAELVRDIFPPPDHAVGALRLERTWLTDTVMTLARHADETGEYGSLPILADALQDAGCDNEFALDRCRTPTGVHCRGNWVVDLLLGRV